MRIELSKREVTLIVDSLESQAKHLQKVAYETCVATKDGGNEYAASLRETAQRCEALATDLHNTSIVHGG